MRPPRLRVHDPGRHQTRRSTRCSRSRSVSLVDLWRCSLNRVTSGTRSVRRAARSTLRARVPFRCRIRDEAPTSTRFMRPVISASSVWRAHIRDTDVVTRFGAYEILYELKTGGMGAVLLGRRRGPGAFEQLVAIKTIRAEYANAPAVRAMFLDEAAILARAQPPRRRDRARLRRGGRHAVHGDGVRRRHPVPRPRRARAAADDRRARDRRGVSRPPRGARAARPPAATLMGARPPRHQPRQPDARLRRPRQGDRLRHRARQEPAGAGHRVRHGQGQAAVHVARAGQERADGSAQRRVLARRRAVGAAHRHSRCSTATRSTRSRSRSSSRRSCRRRRCSADRCRSGSTRW